MTQQAGEADTREWGRGLVSGAMVVGVSAACVVAAAEANASWNLVHGFYRLAAREAVERGAQVLLGTLLAAAAFLAVSAGIERAQRALGLGLSRRVRWFLSACLLAVVGLARFAWLSRGLHLANPMYDNIENLFWLVLLRSTGTLGVRLVLGVYLGIAIWWLAQHLRWERVATGLALSLVGLGLSLQAWLSWVPVPAVGRPNILLIVVDALRPDYIGAYGQGLSRTPHLDRLASSGRLYRKAYANASWTRPSMSSFMTALLPDKLGDLCDPTIGLPDEAVTLAERLSNDGYDTWLINGGNLFVGPRNLFNMGQGFAEEQFLHAPENTAEQVIDRLLEQMRPSTRPWFAYLHLMDVHTPYHADRAPGAGAVPSGLPEPPGDLNMHALRGQSDRGELSSPQRDSISVLYGQQVEFVDHHIGRLLEGLSQRELLADTLIVVTADHGEELWDHGSFGHGHHLYEELIRVPLLVAGPGVARGVEEHQVQLLDLGAGLAAIGTR